MNFVKIPDQDFEMQTTQVTQKQWRDVMGTNPSKFKGDDNPVECVSFFDALEFIKKLNDSQNKYIYRLPTEDEWVASCKEENNISQAEKLDYAWCWENSDNTTHPVGLKKANSFGLHDMLGNVWEWNSTIVDGSHRGLRGGSWGNYARSCRVAMRFRDAPSYRNEYVGFRLARTERPTLLPSNPLSDERAAAARKLIRQIRAKLTRLEKLYE
jgi:formylglycine-generating enzyme required for sulfatase activity